MSTYLVTGSSGLIGSALTEQLRSDGHRVIRLVRTKSQGEDTVSWDPSSGTIDHEALTGLEISGVIHLAGAGIGDRRWNAARKREILESRTLSTQLIAQTVARLAPGIPVVSASAIGFYGSRGDEVLDENSAPGTGFLADVCRAWEQSCEPARTAGSPVTLLRTGIVLDQRGGALKKQLPLFRSGLGGRLGSGNQWMSTVAMADVLGAIRFALSNRHDGPLNAVGPEPVRNREFTATLAHALRRPAFATAPAFALKGVLGGEMANELLMVSQRVVPGELNRLGYRFAGATITDQLRLALHENG